MTRLRAVPVVFGLLFMAVSCSSGGDDSAEVPECPTSTIGGQPAGTTTTLDPRCVQGAEERDGSGDSEAEVWEGTMNHSLTQVGATGPDRCGSPHTIDGTARFVVGPNGEVKGTYDVTGCGISQPHAEFEGTATDEGFSFPDLVVQTNGEPIPKVSPTRARATLTNLQGTAAGGTQWVTTWDMRCTSC
jgi:hypothetical protein